MTLPAIIAIKNTLIRRRALLSQQNLVPINLKHHLPFIAADGYKLGVSISAI
jgi:hypothetical protein